MGDAEFNSVGYKCVSDFGLPQKSGKYFLVMANQQLRVVDLQIRPGGFREWESYPPGIQIQESKIQKWKLIPVQVHDFILGAEEVLE